MWRHPKSRLAIAAAALVLGLAIHTGCADGDAASDGATTAPSSIEVPARWASAQAADLDTLLRSWPVAFAGTVVQLEEQRQVALVGPDLAGKGGRTSSFPVSFYEVHVEEVWSDGVLPGETVTIRQAGGLTSGADGQTVSVRLEGDELLAEGATYLFFTTTSPDDPDVFVTSPFARLEVSSAGRLVPLPAWTDLPGLRAIAGLPLEQAGAVITSTRSSKGEAR